MRGVAVQRLARLSARYTIASAPLSSAAQAADPEGPRVNYALNWALCAKSVAPKRKAYRNLRESQLKKLNATIPARLGLQQGLARLFATNESGASNLYKAPASVVLVTTDSTGAVPEISKVTPEEAGPLFLAGYNGDDLQPGYLAGPGSVGPVELAKGITALLETTNTQAFLVNASGIRERPIKVH